jgi:hypothetical protein
LPQYRLLSRIRGAFERELVCISGFVWAAHGAEEFGAGGCAAPSPTTLPLPIRVAVCLLLLYAQRFVNAPRNSTP